MAGTKPKIYKDAVYQGPDRQAQLSNSVMNNTNTYSHIQKTANSQQTANTQQMLMNKNINTPYLPTANATQKAYLDMAYSDFSKNVDPSVLKYNAVTRDGSSYTASAKKAQESIGNTYGDFGWNTKGGASGSGGIYGRANFQPSEAYNQAMAYTQSLLDKLSTGRTQYTDQINQLMDTINNRASFAYDPDTDPLFQQYLASSMESGKTAMQDTMAQASALTGGYGSTYATAAANGAYNNYVQDAYNNLPEYYQTALNTYNNETENLYSKLNMYNVADQTEYNRLSDAYGNNLAWANDMYGKEYSNYWDSLNYNTSIDQYNADLAYKYAALNQDNEQYYAKLAADIAKSSASGSGNTDHSETEWKSVYSDIDKALSGYGLTSNELADIISYYERQGFDGERMENYARGAYRGIDIASTVKGTIGDVLAMTPMWLTEEEDKKKKK